MSAKRQAGLAVIHRLEDIPAFASESEEAEFWATHAFSEELWDQAEPLAPDELPPPRPPTRAVTIHLDEPTIERVKALASKRQTRYQRLLRELVMARLDEEERRETLAG